MLEKERTEREALNRIKWDENLNPEEFEIFYLDRFEEKLKKLKFSEMRIDGNFIIHEKSRIPMHRIRKIAHKGKVVWAKRGI